MTDDPTEATGRTAWLDDEEQRAWRSLVAMVRHMRTAVNIPLQNQTGLSEIDYAVLVRLSESPEHRLRMSELADYAAVSSSQLAYRMDRLAKLGYIERRPCPSDRRGSLALLTEDGMSALEDAARLHVAAVRHEIIDKLCREELLTLGWLLDKTMAQPEQ